MARPAVPSASGRPPASARKDSGRRSPASLFGPSKSARVCRGFLVGGRTPPPAPIYNPRRRFCLAHSQRSNGRERGCRGWRGHVGGEAGARPTPAGGRFPTGFRPGESRMCTWRGRIDLGDVTIHNIKQLKRLNQVVFPVAYNDKFYKDVLEVGELAKLAYFNDIVVGAVCCREDRSDGRRRLYIMTLGCLAPYRRLGIGSKMLEHVLKICEKDGNYDNIYLHVQVNNEDAVKFYEHFGFEIVERNENYYKRIEPADAYVLQKTFRNDKNAVPGTDSTKNIMEDSIENKENVHNNKS